MAKKKVRTMTTAELCEEYHITRRTAYRWCESGKLHPTRAGRLLLFDRDEVEALATAAYERPPKPEPPKFGPVRYEHLKAEARRAGVSYGDMAKVCGKPSTHIKAAVEGGPKDLTIRDAIAIQRELLPAYSLEYLFELSPAYVR